MSHFHVGGVFEGYPTFDAREAVVSSHDPGLGSREVPKLTDVAQVPTCDCRLGEIVAEQFIHMGMIVPEDKVAVDYDLVQMGINPFTGDPIVSDVSGTNRADLL